MPGIISFMMAGGRFRAPVHRALTEPILLGRRRARGRDRRPARSGRGRRIRASGSGSPGLILRRCGAAAAASAAKNATGLRRRGAAAFASSGAILGSGDAESFRIPQKAAAPCRSSLVPCTGKALSLTRMAPSSARQDFRGRIHSAAPAELAVWPARLNNALRRLGSGWTIFVEASRSPPKPIRRSELSGRRSRGACR